VVANFVGGHPAGLSVFAVIRTHGFGRFSCDIDYSAESGTSSYVFSLHCAERLPNLNFNDFIST